MNHDSVKKTILVAFILCVFCSVLVSVATVALKDKQDINKKLDIQKKLLLIAGLVKNDHPSITEINRAFKNVSQVLIDLDKGDVLKSSNISANDFDYKSAQKDNRYIEEIKTEFDLAKIKKRSKISKIYVIKEKYHIKLYVLPIHGKGLWSTLWGFVAFDPSLTEIKGLGFYEHGETPGLGGEVDNPKWKQLWIGKKPFDKNFNSIIQVIKGVVSSTDQNADHKVDGLSGASMTSRGVQNLINYWLGKNGYGPFLAKIRNGGVTL